MPKVNLWLNARMPSQILPISSKQAWPQRTICAHHRTRPTTYLTYLRDLIARIDLKHPIDLPLLMGSVRKTNNYVEFL